VRALEDAWISRDRVFLLASHPAAGIDVAARPLGDYAGVCEPQPAPIAEQEAAR